MSGAGEDSGLPMKAWADMVSGGDADLGDLLARCSDRYLRRHGCSFMADPAPGWLALTRVNRSAVALSASGVVRSAEFFHIPEIDAFENDPQERGHVLLAASWDDRAALFSPVPPPRRTRDELPGIDWDGANCLRRMPDQIRQFEFLLNSDLRNHPAASLILEPHPPGTRPGHRRMRTDVLSAFTEALSLVQGRDAAAALESFRAALDSSRLKALGAANANSVRAHNWLCGQDRTGCDARRAKLRTQAATAYPVAWPLLSASIGPVPEAIEATSPLAPVLALALGVSENAIRHLNGLTAAAAGIGYPDAEAMTKVAARVARMPQGAAPRTEAGWRVFFAALDLSDSVSGMLSEPRSGADMLASGVGRWDELDAGAVAQAATGLPDMVSDLHSNLLGPGARAVGISDWDVVRSAEVVVGNQSLALLSDTSAWWHLNQAEIRAHLGAAFPPPGQPRGGRTWPPLHKGGPWTATNGLLVHVLCDEDALADEHRLMGHCVNQYSARCLLSGSHILSVRRAGFPVPIGTFEILQEEILVAAGTLAEPPDAPLTRLPPSVLQFKGPRNASPAIEGWEAIWSYVGSILTGGLKLDNVLLRDALAQRIRVAASRADKGAVACYDTRIQGSVAEAWKLYKPALPRSLAKRGPRALVAAPIDTTPDPTPVRGPSP